MVSLAWVIAENPSNAIWVMPNIQLAESFSTTRWVPFLRESPATMKDVPRKQKQSEFTKTQQRIGSSLLNFLGSNSPANLASRPARVVIMDETDKFDRGGNREADAVNLVEQRTKTFAMPKRMKSSTPTLVEGVIWQEFLKGDQRRYFVPCPHCSEFILLAWGPDYSIMKRQGCEAYMQWEGKLPDHQWDFDVVERTAHLVCPRCKGKITDAHKTKMLRGGEWRPTAEGAKHFVSRHLPSLYAVGPQTTFGKLAVNFLQAKASLMGLQGFINGTLAEPWEHQDSRSERIEIVARGDVPLDDTTPVKILTVDHQQIAPYFWYVVRAWTIAGHSRLCEQGHRDRWEDIRQVQLDQSVQDHHVTIDSGYKTSDVYTHCLGHGQLVPATGLPVWRGWTPSKGRGREVRYKDKASGTYMPYLLTPAPLPQRQFRLMLFEFSADWCLDVLSRLRKNREGGFRWELLEGAVDEEYYRQMDAKILDARVDKAGNTFYEWKKRSHRWPDHLLDCEVMQLAFAAFHRLFPWGSISADPEVDK